MFLWFCCCCLLLGFLFVLLVWGFLAEIRIPIGELCCNNFKRGKKGANCFLDLHDCAWWRSLARLQKSDVALFFRFPYCCCLFLRVDQWEGLKESPESFLSEAQDWKLFLAQLGRDSSDTSKIGGGSSRPCPDPWIPCSCILGQSLMEEITVMLSMASF